MLDPTDMSTPITRGELREEIAHLEARLDQKLDNLEARLDQKLDNLEARLDQKLEQKLKHVATKADLDIWGGALLERLLTELVRHTRAIQESMSTQISAVDEQYTDLPARVTRLEATVFTPNRR